MRFLFLHIEDIDFVKEFKFLGMASDSTGFTWGKHIYGLKTKSVSNINLLSNIFGRDWESDRKTLLLLYKSLIRSYLDSGAIFYSSASQTDLKK